MVRNILLLFLFLLTIVIVGLVYRSYTLHNSPQQALFIKGKAPDPELEGYYAGNESLKIPFWKGKIFDSNQNTGTNHFEHMWEENRFPFKSSIANGLTDTDQEVLKIDYNVPENSFIIRPFLDEVVETEPGKYLGKAYVRIVPGLSLLLGFFELTPASLIKPKLI